MNIPHFETEKFLSQLLTRLREKRTSPHKLSRILQFHPNVFTRLKAGKLPGFETMLRIFWWSGLNLRDYFRER